MKISELREMTVEELNVKELEIRRELLKQNAQVATGTTPKNPSQLKTLKQTIAKIKTTIQEKGGK